MGEKADSKLRSGAEPFLEPNEPIVAMLGAAVRGKSQAMAGGVAGMIGGSRAGKARRDAESIGIKLGSYMTFVLTPSRLLILETGNGGKVKGLLQAVPLADVGGMEVKRLGLGASVTITILDTPVKLEARVGASREFADELGRVKAA